MQCRGYFGKTSIYIVVHLLIYIGETINIGLLKGNEFGETLQKIMEWLMQDEVLADDDGNQKIKLKLWKEKIYVI